MNKRLYSIWYAFIIGCIIYTPMIHSYRKKRKRKDIAVTTVQNQADVLSLTQSPKEQQVKTTVQADTPGIQETAATTENDTAKSNDADTQKPAVQPVVFSSDPLPYTRPNKPEEQAINKALNSIRPVELYDDASKNAKHYVAKKSEFDVRTEQAPMIEFNFEKADLITLVNQIEDIFNITFITDEIIQPLSKNGKIIAGNKISFKSNKPLSKQDAWNLFVDFLSMAGFTITPDAHERRFRIKSIEIARKSPIPSFIGTDTSILPDNDQLIRYVYFIQNSTLETIQGIVEALRSPQSSLLILNEHKAFILTDKSYNIKTLITIVKELDKGTMPPAMTVLKLHRADSQQVKEVYESLTKSEENLGPRLFAKKQPTSLYFPENSRIIAEPRTNSLILLGTQESNKRIEDFIVRYIDVDLDQPYSPLHTYQLKYADAITVAELMNNVCQFGSNTPAGKSGGVRSGDKYLKQIAFIPETETNRIIIKGNYDDYVTAKKILDSLDEAQPQVAMEILLVSISLNNQKQLGSQIRSKTPSALDGIIGNNVKFQTSGLYQTAPIIQNTSATTGAQRLLGNLVNLASNTTPGNTLITFGTDAYGVWGVFQALENMVNAQIVANPFLVATNKTPAEVTVGETRRVQTGNIVGVQTTQAFGDYSANLTVKAIPQINSDGMIVLDLDITIDSFTNPTDPTSAEKNTKQIKTTTIVANKEVLALGGLIRTNVSHAIKKVPILGDIPILGWLFKNRDRSEDKESLLVLISTRIVEPLKNQCMNEFTKERMRNYKNTIDLINSENSQKDPINKFFDDSVVNDNVENFIFKRNERCVGENAKIQDEIDKKNTPVQLCKTNDTLVQQASSPSDTSPANDATSVRIISDITPTDEPHIIVNNIAKQRSKAGTIPSLSSFFNTTRTEVHT